MKKKRLFIYEIKAEKGGNSRWILDEISNLNFKIFENKVKRLEIAPITNGFKRRTVRSGSKDKGAKISQHLDDEGRSQAAGCTNCRRMRGKQRERAVYCLYA